MPRRSGGDVEPGWTLPEKNYHAESFGPVSKDKHYYRPHWNYSPLTQELRLWRPYFEQVGGNMRETLRTAYAFTVHPVFMLLDAHLPGFLPKALAAAAATFTCGLLFTRQNLMTHFYFTLEKLHFLKVAQELDHEGFWRSPEQAATERQAAFEADKKRLNEMYESALAEATDARSFDVLCQRLAVDEASVPAAVPVATPWLFDNLPYGENHPDSHTFPTPAREQPTGRSLKELAPDAGNYGDYVERRDNKGPSLRKARHLYAMCYTSPIDRE